MKTTATLLIAIVLIFSCTEKKKESAQDKLMEGVMAVHDAVMPKMGDIMKYKKQLSEKIQALEAAGDSTNQVAIDNLKRISDELETAHKDMMDWMHEFSNDFEGMTEEDVVKYLNDQRTKIEEVGLRTEKALKEAVDELQ